MIRLAIKHPEYPSGGAERVTEHIVHYLTPRGYQIFIIAERLNHELLSDFDRQNVTFVVQPPTDRRSEEYADFLVETINEHGIDILLCPVFGAKHIERVRNGTQCKIVFAHHSLPGWEAIDYYEFKRHKLRRTIATTLFWWLIKRPFEKMRGRVWRSMVKRYRNDYANCDLLTMLTPEYKEQMIRILGVSPTHNHIEVTPNYIEPRDYGTPEKKKQLIFVGRLSYPDKRVDRLLDIWALLWRDYPDWELLIVGSGDEMERLNRQAANMERVRFCGSTATPWSYYRDASIVCLTSTVEGWGLAITEGMQAGCVPVAFDVSAGLRDQIEEGCGFLVPPFDKKAYAVRLGELMSDDALRESMARNAVAKAQTYSSQELLAKWDEEFQKLLIPNS